MQAEDHDVHIFTTTRNLASVGVTKTEDITIHRFYSPAVVWNINPLTLMLRSLMKSESDVFHIHSHLYFSSNQAIIAKVLKQKPALLHLHGGVGIPPYDVGILKLVAKHFYAKSLGEFTIKNSNVIASVSKSDLEEISTRYSLPETRLRYVPNMVDTDVFKPTSDCSPEKKSLLYLGDLEPWKGVGSLIKWINLMNKSFSEEITFRFVGQGSCMQNLLRLRSGVQKSGNGVSVEIMGQREHVDIPTILRSSSALILPSYWEGMPTVVLEAMATGIPVISTPVGDIPTLIRHKETGFIIDRSFTSFKDAVSQILRNHSVIKNISTNARKMIVRDYSLQKVTRSVAHIYSELASW